MCDERLGLAMAYTALLFSIQEDHRGPCAQRTLNLLHTRMHYMYVHMVRKQDVITRHLTCLSLSHVHHAETSPACTAVRMM